MPRISELNPTAFPTLEAQFPVTHDGETNRYSLNQVRELLQYTAAEIMFNEISVEAALLMLASEKADQSDVDAALLALAESIDETVVRVEEQEFTPAEQGQALANIGAGVLAGFRNKIINGNFTVWQRGTSLASAFWLADRWQWTANGSGGVAETSRQLFTPGQTAVPGEPAHFLRVGFTTARTGQTFNVLRQKIESVRTLAGKTATLTFYALSSEGDFTLTTILQQNFGSGDSPSSTVTIEAGSHTISNGWQRFNVVLSIPSIAGKTIGSDGNDALDLQFGLPVNSTARLRIARVSLVEGDASADPDPFASRHPAQELALCQRYFWRGLGGASFNQFTTGTGQAVSWHIGFPVTMRAEPTLSNSGLASGGSWSTLNFSIPTKDGGRLIGANSTSGNSTANITIDSGGYLEADAEL